MKADGHRRHAESLELGVTLAQQNPNASVALIEAAWGAAYHWIGYGCIQKHQQHRDKHQGLASYLDGLGEHTAAQLWRSFEDLRQSGFYGNHAGDEEVQKALLLLENIRTWAIT
jgi:hypothetical protein